MIRKSGREEKNMLNLINATRILFFFSVRKKYNNSFQATVIKFFKKCVLYEKYFEVVYKYHNHLSSIGARGI